MSTHLTLTETNGPTSRHTARLDMAHLLYMVAYGEDLAAYCAHWQSTVVHDRRSQRFFAAQYHQERFHRRFFQRVATRLAPAYTPPGASFCHLETYRERLYSAIRHERWFEVLVGQQLVLEGIGEIALRHMDDRIFRDQDRFQHLRKLILRQEHAHHAYGLRQIDDAIAAQAIDTVTLRDLAQPYLDLAECMLNDASGLLTHLNIDASCLQQELWSDLPDWLRQDRQ